MLRDLKRQVRTAQLTAQRRVNTELVSLYWSIGNTILERQADQGWGSSVIARLAEDLRAEFPAMRGFSRSNFFYMRGFAKAWPGRAAIVQQAAGLLPWGHIMLLLDKLEDLAARDWYAERAAEYGWSRNLLMNQIMNRTRERIGSSPSNFAGHLAPSDSDLARELAKDPYVFDFLDLTADVAERDLEQALMGRLVDTLRELDEGFAFVGRQVHIEVAGDDFFIDLLYFHTEQLRYVVIELKTGRFEPAYAGQTWLGGALGGRALSPRREEPPPASERRDVLRPLERDRLDQESAHERPVDQRHRADRHRLRQRGDERAERGLGQSPHLHLERGAARGDPHDSWLGRHRAEREETIVGARGRRLDEFRVAVGQLVVERLTAEVGAGDGEEDGAHGRLQTRWASWWSEKAGPISWTPNGRSSTTPAE